MTVLLIFGCVALTLFTALGVSFAVMFRQSVRDATDERTRIGERHSREMSSLLNRLMAVRWEDFITIEETAAAEEGGFFPPGEGEEDETLVGGQWGALSEVRARAQALDENESQLINEDFPDKPGGAR